MTDDRYSHIIRRDCPLPPGTHVVAYCRDSGGEDQDRSVKQQKAAVEEYCRAHDLVLEQTYIDEARTGSDGERRSGLNMLLHDLTERFPQIRQLKKRQKFMDESPFGLVTWKSARLGRDSIEATLHKADIRVRGIQIISLIAGVSTGDPAADAMLEIFEQYRDEKLLDDIAEQSRRGLADLVSMRDNDPDFLAFNPGWESTGAYLGIMPGPLPRGFAAHHIVVGVHKRKSVRAGGEKRVVRRLVPNHEDNEWERCRLAWEMRLAGDGIQKIMRATRLYKSTSGYDHFFENRIYTGTLVYGGQVYEHFVPALISHEMFAEEQARRVERSKKTTPGKRVDPQYEPRRLSSSYLLTGLVFCGAVDGEEHPMVGDANAPKRNKRWRYYECTHRKNTRGSACQAPRISAAGLEQSVIDTIMEKVLTKERLEPLVHAIAQSLEERNRDAEIRIATVRTALDEADRAAKRIVDAIEQIGLTPQLRDRLNEREAEIRSLRTDLARLEQLMVTPDAVERVSGEQLGEWIEAMRAALHGEDRLLARQAVQAFVWKVVVVKKEGTIYFTFPFTDKPRIHSLTPSGKSTYPTIYDLVEHFKTRRRPRTVKPTPEPPERAALRARIRELRASGMSYPGIARELNISIGAAWNLGHD